MREVTPEDREAAWIGDAVLSLFARSFILREEGRMDQEKLQAMTCNQFLCTIGNPTKVEAEIGRVYQQNGLEAAFQHIEAQLMPEFAKQWKNRKKR
jgi:dsRNA-specific ribonuclease